ncbi:MAG: hypothetical protein KBE09_01150 [Candidatus Pacebacteria bacterium]|nr:hypothetical protein [Candidatus Paceibacterota bacterium]
MGVAGVADEPPHKTGIVADIQDLPHIGHTLLIYEYKADALETPYAKELRNTYLSATEPMAIICVPVKGAPSIIMMSDAHKQADKYTINGRLLRVRLAQRVDATIFVPE